MDDTLYLVWFDAPTGLPDGFDWHGDVHALANGLWLVRSELTRSKLYHRIKWQLPDGTPLLVAPLEDSADGWPKFKGMEAGALKWLRHG